MVTTFWPRVGKQNENIGDLGRLRKRVQKLERLRPQKNKIFESGSAAFSFGPFEAVDDDVNPDAKLVRARCRVRVEEMPVATADFEGDPRMNPKNLGHLLVESGATFFRAREVREGASRIFHAPWLVPQPTPWQS